MGVAPDVKTGDQLVQLALLVFGSNSTGIVNLCHNQYLWIRPQSFKDDGMVDCFVKLLLLLMEWPTVMYNQSNAIELIILRLTISVDRMLNEFWRNGAISSD